MAGTRRQRALGWWAELVSRHPWPVLTVAGLLTIASVVLSAARLGFQPNRNDLIARSLPWNQRFLEWQSAFPGGADLVIAIDAQPHGEALTPQRVAEAEAMADDLGRALLASGHVDPRGGGAVWRFSAERASPRALRLLPMEEFRLRLDQLRRSRELLESPTPEALLGRVERRMLANESAAASEGDGAARGIGEFTDLINAFAAVLGAPPGDAPSLAVLMAGAQGRPGWEYLASENGRMYFIRVTPKFAADELNALAPAIAGIREVIAAVESRHPSFDAGLTGIEVVEADETDAATRDAAIASAVALVLITAMLVVAYHSIKTPLLAMGALLVGVSWAFGFTTLAIGHLQVLSVIFATMLLGISDAYGVHLAAKYELIRHNYPDDEQGFIAAMRESFQTMGPGILTGALVTAAAFFTTVFTKFTGVAEMGLISGVGILLCLLAMFTVYPALIRLFKPWRRHVTPVEERWVQVYSDRWVMPFARHPRATLAAAGLLTALSVVAITRMDFEYDLLKLQPRHVESVEWARRIAEDGGQSIYTGVSVAADMADARRKAAQFLALPGVAYVGGVGRLFPADEAVKLGMVRELREELGLSPESDTAATRAAVSSILSASQPSTAPGDVLARMSALRTRLAAAAFVGIPPDLQKPLDELSAALDRVLDASRGWGAAERAARLARLRSAYDQWRGAIFAALDTGPLEPGDLPGEVLRPYLAASPGDSRVVLDIVPRLPDRQTTGIDSALHPDFLGGFIARMRSVDPNVTGVIVQVYESNSLILRTYVRSGVAALLIVFAMVLIDFRSLSFALLSLAPVAIGFAVTFGVMYLFGVSINPANIIVLPLMFGIGIDSGVHILHRYQQDPRTRPLGLSGGTGKAITITALTTIVGFATLIPARHRGISSLGVVLTAGLTLTLAACLAVMPAWLELREAGRRRAAKPAPPRAGG